jgi:hypothetical protein
MLHPVRYRMRAIFTHARSRSGQALGGGIRYALRLARAKEPNKAAYNHHCGNHQKSRQGSLCIHLMLNLNTKPEPYIIYRF